MSTDQFLVIGLLGGMLGLFVWGRLRFDLVAVIALLGAVLIGLVPAADAFVGFGHPAVITVAAILVISHGLSASGAVEAVATKLIPGGSSDILYIGVFCVIAAVLSGFMNNVGALALLMPVAIQTAIKTNRSPAMILLPVSFASILGGLFTLIGTPPNLIVASYRARETGAPFAMFDFAPVGGVIAVVGVIFVALVGWRLIPRDRIKRKRTDDIFEIADYVSEARVPKGSDFVGKTLRETEEVAEKNGVDIVGLIRKKNRISLDRRRRIETGDILILEAAPEALGKAAQSLGLELIAGGQAIHDLTSDDVCAMEAVVGPRSELIGQTPKEIRFRRRWRVNLLAASRQGTPYRGRLKDFRFQTGDVLLIQGDVEQVPSVITRMGCLPLAERSLQLAPSTKGLLAVGLFALAIGLTASGLLAAPVAFTLCAVGMFLTRILTMDEAYRAVDWPIVILLAALIPVGGALETTGTTAALATWLLDIAQDLSPVLILALVMIVTMTLSDIINNAATAVVMAPLSIAIAQGLGVSADPFLMAVAIGASCAFLTPIGHQNNALVMGPGGYKFGDYWRIGLPLEAIIVVVAVPMLVLVWPLTP